MREHKAQADATLLDILVDGFEKNEVFGGFHHRWIPMPDEPSAARKFASLSDEARRWKGAPLRTVDEPRRRLVAWPDMELRQAGRGVLVRVRAPWFDEWWHERGTWAGDPVAAIYDWLDEERDEPKR